MHISTTSIAAAAVASLMGVVTANGCSPTGEGFCNLVMHVWPQWYDDYPEKIERWHFDAEVFDSYCNLIGKRDDVTNESPSITSQLPHTIEMHDLFWKANIDWNANKMGFDYWGRSYSADDFTHDWACDQSPLLPPPYRQRWDSHCARAFDCRP